MIDRLKRSIVGRVLARYGAAKGGTWAKVVAWNAILSFFPLVLVTVTLLGVAFRFIDPDIGNQVKAAVASAMGNGAPISAADFRSLHCGGGAAAENQRQIACALNAFQQKPGIFAIVGLLSLAWSGSALVEAFDQAINALYPCRARGFVPQKIMAVGVILIFTVLTIPLMLSSALLTAVKNIPYLPAFIYDDALRYVLQVGLGVLDSTLLFAAVYYIVPYRRQKFRRILPGAFVGGILLELFTLAFPLYAKISHGFNTYGQYFALFFLLLSYFYFLGQILMLGATVNAELDPDPGKCVEEEAEPAGGLAPTEGDSPVAQLDEEPHRGGVVAALAGAAAGVAVVEVVRRRLGR